MEFIAGKETTLGFGIYVFLVIVEIEGVVTKLRWNWIPRLIDGSQMLIESIIIQVWDSN